MPRPPDDRKSELHTVTVKCVTVFVTRAKAAADPVRGSVKGGWAENKIDPDEVYRTGPIVL